MSKILNEEIKSIGKGRIAVVIDDNPIIRKSNKLILEKMSFDVRETPDPRVVLEAMDVKGPDFFSLIVIDLVIPAMSGAEFISVVKERYPNSEVKIVVCSCVTDVNVIRHIASLGLDGYVIKPVDYSAFIYKIREIFCPEL